MFEKPCVNHWEHTVVATNDNRNFCIFSYLNTGIVIFGKAKYAFGIKLQYHELVKTLKQHCILLLNLAMSFQGGKSRACEKITFMISNFNLSIILISNK